MGLDRFTLNFWNKTSNYAAIGCVAFGIFLRFFKKYIDGYVYIIQILGTVSFVILVVSGIMIFFLNRKAKRDGQE